MAIHFVCSALYHQQLPELQASDIATCHTVLQELLDGPCMHLAHCISDGNLMESIVSIVTTLQEAADVYKRLLMEHRDFSALNVYLGLCYSKLDYFDVSSEILEGYLQLNPDSAAAVNLKACNLFKLYTGKAAEAEIKVQSL